jgi:hypothetical protein
MRIFAKPTVVGLKTEIRVNIEQRCGCEAFKGTAGEEDQAVQEKKEAYRARQGEDFWEGGQGNCVPAAPIQGLPLAKV